ncbi:MAG: hypothetical protein NVV74_26180 [Magnetospirillum sp.]|nr:hypothetical protein [Magnetospirillum sp.]
MVPSSSTRSTASRYSSRRMRICSEKPEASTPAGNAIMPTPSTAVSPPRIRPSGVMGTMSP